MRHSRRSPAPELAPWILNYWLVSWDLSGCDPHRVETLPHPNVHLVFEWGITAAAWGVRTKKFSRTLEGRSQVFGIKFQPGAVRSFLAAPVSTLTDRVVAAREVFWEGLEGIEEILLCWSRTEDERVAAADQFFRRRTEALKLDSGTLDATRLVAMVLEEAEIKTVEDLSARSGIGMRSLQRLFREYVGVSPKWVIRRYRLHELVAKLNPGADLDWAQLALELGYFDQAHLINDFRSITGRTPGQYRRLVTPAGGQILNRPDS